MFYDIAYGLGLCLCFEGFQRTLARIRDYQIYVTSRNTDRQFLDGIHQRVD